MDAKLKKLLTKLAAFWNKVGKKTRILIIGGAAVVVLLAIILNIAMTATRYTQLFTGLSDSESGAVVTQLKTMGVKYKLDGNAIYVDSAKADETRMSLAESGYPQSTLTYSVYTSGNTWADTDSDKKQKVLYQLQNRLQDTINTIPSVKSSIVTIVDNQNDTYVLNSDKVKATASVKLNLLPGVTLSKTQINGIVQLVASSVPDLSSDDVAVISSDGTQLNQSSSDLSGSTSEQLALKNTVETEIKQKVLSVLSPLFGSGNVQVAAGATLNFDQTTTSKTTYTAPSGSPSGAGMPTSQSTGVTVNGGGSTASGTAGVNNGQPTYATSSGSTGGTVTQSTQQTSYLYNAVSQQIKSQGGTMTGLTIAVLLNNKSQNAAATDTKAISQAVAFAVGLTDTNDITVQLVPFQSAAVSASSAVAAPGAAINPLILYAAAGTLGIAILAAILLTLISRKKRKKAAALAALQPTAIPAATGKAAALIPADGESPESQVSDLKSIEQSIEEAESKNTVKNQIAEFADDKPELVAQLLKNWLKD